MAERLEWKVRKPARMTQSDGAMGLNLKSFYRGLDHSGIISTDFNYMMLFL
jgi:hypothetical protein